MRTIKQPTLFDCVQVGLTVLGKTTGMIYTVHAMMPEAAEYEDAVILRNHRGTLLEYTKAQFNHHFMPN